MSTFATLRVGPSHAQQQTALGRAWWRDLFIGLTLIALIAALLPQVVDPSPQVATTPIAASTAATSQRVAPGQIPDGFTAAEWSGIQAQMAGATAAALPVAGTYSRVIPATGSEASFTSAGATLRRGEFAATLSLATINGVGALAPTPTEAGEFIEYHHGNVTEWYRATSAGIQQGFTISAAPVDPKIALTIATGGHIPTQVSPQHILLTDPVTGSTFNYRDLIAFDANGVDLPASMRVGADKIVLQADLTGAAFPVTIDPILTEEQTLLSQGDNAGIEFGIAADVWKTDAVISSLQPEGSTVGAVESYTRTNAATWVRNATFDHPDFETFADNGFGVDVAIVDGAVFVGAHRDSDDAVGAGAVYVFDNSGTFLTKITPGQTQIVAPYDGSEFGFAVDATQDPVSGDLILLVGAPGNGPGQVATLRSNDGGASWTTTSNLTGRTAIATGARFGSAVDIEFDPNGTAGDSVADIIAVVGAPNFGPTTGNVDTYAWCGNQGAPLCGATEWFGGTSIAAPSADCFFGASVAMGFDGATPIVVVGNPGYERLTTPGVVCDQGDVFAYTLDGGQGAGAVLLDSVSDNQSFAASVSYSNAGTALVGYPFADANGVNSGAVHAFSLDTTNGFVLGQVFDGNLADFLGTAVAIDELYGVAGAPLDDASFRSGTALLIDTPLTPVGTSTVSPLSNRNFDNFGFSIAVDGNRMAVAALDDSNAADAGIVYLYERASETDPWVVLRVINPPNPANAGSFGSPLDLDGDFLAVGQRGPGATEFSVSVFDRNGGLWSQRGPSITAPNTDRWGDDIALRPDGDLYISNPTDAGALEFWEFDGANWSSTSVVPTQSLGAGDNFGESLDIDNGFLATSAPGDDDAGPEAGALFLFDITGPAAVQVQKYANDIDWSGGSGVGHNVVLDAQDVGDVRIAATSTDPIVYVASQQGAAFSVNQIAVNTNVATTEDGWLALDGNAVVVGLPASELVEAEVYRYDLATDSWLAFDTVEFTPDNDGDATPYNIALEGFHLVLGLGPNDDGGFDAGQVYTTSVTAGVAPGDPLPVSVDIDGQFAAIGVPEEDQIYVVERVDGTWDLAGALQISGPAGTDFGASITMTNSYMIVGAPGDTNDTGAAWLYRRDAGGSWPLLTLPNAPGGKIAPAAFEPGDRFGTDVSAANGVLVVGAPGYDGTGNDTLDRGAGAVFAAPSYALDIILTPGDEGDQVGNAVAAAQSSSDRSIWIGNPNGGVGGQVYGYRFNAAINNTPDYTLEPTGAVPGMEFGFSIDAALPRVIIVGAPGAGDGQDGQAHVFYIDAADNPNEEVLAPFLSGPGDRYGESVDINGDIAAIGAPGISSIAYFSDNGAATAIGSTGPFSETPTITSAQLGYGSDIALLGNVRLASFDVQATALATDAAELRTDLLSGPANKTTAPAPTDGDFFGSAFVLTSDENTLIVSSPRADDLTGNGGRLTVFKRNGAAWDEDQIITSAFGFNGIIETVGPNTIVAGSTDQVVLLQRANTTSPFQFVAAIGDPDGTLDGSSTFGSSIAVAGGDTLVIGDPNDGDGTVYVYPAGLVDWISPNPQIQELESPVAVDQGRFGLVVDASGNSIAVGEPPIPANNAPGSVYVFTRPDTASLYDTTPEATLTGSQNAGGGGDLYGTALVLDSNRLLVGAASTDVVGPGFTDNTGAAYVYDRSGTVWTETATLEPAGALPNGQLGTAVALKGENIVLGAPITQVDANNQGAAHAFTLVGGQWLDSGTFTASDADQNDQLGTAVILTDVGEFVAGAPGEDQAGADAGAFYEFTFAPPAPPEPANKLIAPPGSDTADDEVGDIFGYRVEVDGNTMAVGAPEYSSSPFGDFGSALNGGVYVFTRLTSADPWILEQHIPNPTGGRDEFGRGLALDGDTMLVGAPADGSGTVTWFERTAGVWTESGTLPATGLAGSSVFGESIGLDDGLAVVGASNLNPGALAGAGRAYFFELDPVDGWLEVLAIDGEAADDRFGWGATLEGNIAAVAAASNTSPGYIKLYDRSGGTWVEIDRIDNAGPPAQFGRYMDLDAGRLAAGAPNANEGAGPFGAVYLYEFDGNDYALTETFVPAAVPSEVDFGFSVELDGQVLAIGATKSDVAATDGGEVYVFGDTGAGWVPLGQFTAEDADTTDLLGFDVAISGNEIYAGAPIDSNTNGLNAGGIYEFGVVIPQLPDDPTIEFTFDRAVGSPATVEVAPTGIAVADINAALLEDNADGDGSVASTPLSSVDLAETPLSSVAVGATPLSSVVLDSAPLSSVPLLSVDVVDGWPPLLEGTDLENVPLVELTLGRALENSTVRGRIEALPLSSVDILGTPLSSVPLSSVALGTLPLSSVPLSSVGLDWCTIIEPILTDVICTTEADLTDITLMEATLRGVPLSSVPLSSVPLSSVPINQTALADTPLSSVNFAATPLSSVPLSSVPLSSVPLSSVELSELSRSSLPLSSVPLSSVTLGALNLANAPLSSVPLSSVPVSITLEGSPLSSVPLSSVPLSSVPLSSVLLANSPLSSVPLSSVDGTPIDWCDLLAEIGGGYDCASGVDPTTTTIRTLLIQGIPLSSVPLSSVPLSSVPLSSVPLSSVPLSSVPLSSVPLSSVPLSSVELGSTPLSSVDPDATPLSSVPLSSVPLSSVQVEGSPLSSVPLSSVLIAGTPLSSVPLSSVPLSSVPLSSVPLSSVPLSSVPNLGAIPLSSVDIALTPLSSVPLSSVPLSSVGVNCALVDCVNGTLADAVAAGAIPLNTTLIELQIALSGIRLGDLLPGLIGITEAEIVAGIEAWGGTLGSLTDLDDLTLGDIPSTLPQFLITTLGQLEPALWSVRLGDLIGRLIDSNTGLPFDEVITEATLRGALDPNLDVGDLLFAGDVTIGDILADSGDTLTFEVLGPLLGFIHVEDILTAILEAEFDFPPGTLAGLLPEELGDLTLLDLYDQGIVEFDSWNLGDLWEALEAAGALDGLTLGDLLLALLGPNGLPLSGVDFAAIDTADLPDSVIGAIRFESGFTIGNTSRNKAVELSVVLPGSASYVPGSAELVIDPDLGGALPPQPVSPTINNGEATWVFDTVGPNDTYSVTFEVRPTIGLGITTLTSTARVLGTDLTSSGTASVAVAEGLEDNDFPATTPLAEDTVYLTYLSDDTDNDVFSVAVQENDRLAVELGNLPADFDVALYGDFADPAEGQALSGASNADPIIPITDPDNPDGVSAEVQNDFRRLDQIDTNLELLEVANVRGTETELIISDRLPAGTYYVQVFGANGASSSEPATLQGQILEAETEPECLPLGTQALAAPGPAPVIAPDTNTLIVMNQQRLEQLFSATDRAGVTTSVNDFIAYLDANPSLGINAAVVAVDSSTAVRTAYANWDAPANPSDACDPTSANAVVGAIIDEFIDPIRATNDIDHIMFVGGDDIVPMARLDDATTEANEYDFRHEFIGDAVGSLTAVTPFTSTSWDSVYLSDEPYGETAAESLGSRYLYVADSALGRLVETPDQIIGSMQDFIDFSGSLDVSTGAVLGYDFLVDGSEEIAADLTGALGAANVDATLADGIDDADGLAWDRDDVAASLLPPGGQSPDLISLNAHFDHYRALPAAGDKVPGFTDNFQADTIRDALPASLLDSSLIFSMGCHSGLSVSNVQVGSTNGDFAEAISGQGGLFVGNTGFGYGDTVTVAYSEKLMALFAQRVVEPIALAGQPGGTTVGQALQYAKQDFRKGLALLSVYDEKSLMESTFYGIPFYRVGLPTIPAPPVPTNTVTPDITGTLAAPYNLAPANNQQVTALGTYYSNPDANGDEQVITIPGRPVQPRDEIDVSVVNPANAEELAELAHGALITGMTSSYAGPIDPVIAEAVFDSASSSPESELSDAVFPAQPVTITNYQAPDGARQSLVAATGQFRADGQVQRLDSAIDYTVYYSALTETDFTPPSIGRVESALADGEVTITADISDANGVDRVLILVAENPGVGTVVWTPVDLAPSGGDQWSGSLATAPGTTNVEFLVQAKDPAGNIGYATNKAENFGSDVNDPPPPPPPPGLTVNASNGNLDPATGWYTGPAQITVDSGTEAAEYSVDGGAYQPVTGGSFAIGTEGIHSWSVRTGSGKMASGIVRLDLNDPEILFGTPSFGATYPVNGGLTLDVVCRDAGIGISNCALLLDGASANAGDPIDNVVGTRTLAVTATDGLGRQTSAAINFFVQGGADPMTPLGINADFENELGDAVSVLANFDGGANHVGSIDWGDGSVCSTPAGPDCSLVPPSVSTEGRVTGTHTYANSGLYTIAVTVASSDGTTIVQTTEIVVCDVLGSSGGDFLIGTNGPDVLCGGGGHDIIGGFGGDDILVGGDGNDWLIGSGGNDTLFGGDGGDWLFNGSGDDTAFGGDGNDLIGSQGGNDTIDAGDGNDWVVGTGGVDTIVLGPGNDLATGGRGDDTISGDDGLDFVSGGPGNDIIDGGADDDRLFGNSGDDEIDGGPGNDQCSGGLGSDQVENCE